MPGESDRAKTVRATVLLREFEVTQRELIAARAAVEAGEQPQGSLRSRVVRTLELLSLVQAVPERACRKLYVEVGLADARWSLNTVVTTLDLLERGVEHLRKHAPPVGA
ncbi:MAG: hypothetical protein R3B89_32510 [Polyangiaceae bacterium]